MAWIADLHIHSHYSMATSKDGNPVNLHRWAGLKGISLVGTGDFTHPGWRQELRDNLVEAEPGFYRLKNAPPPEIPDQPEVRFVVSGELSNIYKKNGRTRKVHNLLILPSLEAADKISSKLESLGMNIRSDGRPILGMDSYHLFQMALDLCPEMIFIPAHIWTPHFSVFGSNSGFDTITECYEDLTDYINALETGLSSDPAMNWQWSALDRFSLVSNSDAHNPQNLGREANLFDAEFSYQGLKNALADKGDNRLAGTIEFFPEEGKYHFDGHRNCGVTLAPEETAQYGGICPVCGRKLTVGVLNRVDALADRPRGFQPEKSRPFQRLVPLRQVIGDAYRVGAGSRKVETVYFNLLHHFGPELSILREIDIDLITQFSGTLLGTAIKRLREGTVDVKPGYDGEYGVISIIKDTERHTLVGQTALFQDPVGSKRLSAPSREEAAACEVKSAVAAPEKPAEFCLSTEQQAIIHSLDRVIRVVAGPGTGKTRTLVERIISLICDQGVDPGEITAVTFTNKAAGEIRERLERHPLLSANRLRKLNIGTFHSLAWKILKRDPHPMNDRLVDATEAQNIIAELIRSLGLNISRKDAALWISRLKNGIPVTDLPADLSQDIQKLSYLYQQSLQKFGRMDFDDIILRTIHLWQEDPEWLEPVKREFNYLMVDEFQDVNPAQYLLVKLWAGASGHLMVIGDPNQAIYRFRGSDSRFFEKLEADFTETRSFNLTHNYRSPAEVIEAANSLVPEEYRQVVKANPASKTIHWFEADNSREEARAVVGEIITLLGGSTMLSAHGQGSKNKRRDDHETFSLSDFAILFRTGRQAENFEEILLHEGLPYRVTGQTETFDSESVQEFLAFFRYLYRPEDPFLLYMALRQPRWAMNAADLDILLPILLAKAPDDTPDSLEFLLSRVEGDILRDKLNRFTERVAYYRDRLKKTSQSIIDEWMADSGLKENLELSQLAKLSENYRNLSDLIQFLPFATEADLNRYSKKSHVLECITLSTIHAAKGIEYPVVFVTGVEEGLLPYGRESSSDAIAEEQRLFYVGVTRAQRYLYLTNAIFRFNQGNRSAVDPSRFLKKIPAHLLQKQEWHHKSSPVRQLQLFK